MNNHSGTLEGVTVIDFTSMMAGPYGTRILADCGARVIKIEAETGDYMRYRSPIRDGRSAYYGQMNSGKESIALDLKNPRGRQIAHDLIRGADVVVENYRPGVMKSLGLSYDELKASCPRLIYCSISGFGQSGKRARDPAYAPIIHAASGYDMAHMTYNSHLERPQMTGIFNADAFAAVYAFGAIQSALYHRERFGAGQHIDVNLIDTMLNLLVYECQEAQFEVTQKRPLYQPLKASDGFVMVAPVNQKNFENLADVVGRPEWKTDARFCTNNAREHHWQELMDLLEEWTIQRTAQQCEDILMKAGVPSSRYATVADLFADAEMQARGSFTEISDHSGSYRIPVQPFRFSQAAVVSRQHVADVGEDTDAILRDMLNLSADAIAEARASGAVF
ncbi:MAG: CaiB/BaiF CoA transferase family protein [Flavobacteriaceae bacterium]